MVALVQVGVLMVKDRRSSAGSRAAMSPSERTVTERAPPGRQYATGESTLITMVRAPSVEGEASSASSSRCRRRWRWIL